MISNRLAFGVLALTCVAAAAGGGYLATRQANLTTEAAAPSAVLDPAANSVVTLPNPAPEASVATSTPLAAPIAPDPVAEPVRRREVNRSQPVRGTVPVRSSEASAVVVDQRASERVTPTTPVVEVAPAPVETQAAQAQADSRVSTPESVTATESLPSTPVSPVNFEELLVSADSVIGLELDRGVTSERARVEDDVEARVVRDVRVGRRVAISAGSRALGSVVLVERGGKFKERARLGIRFHTLVLADGSRLPIQTDTIYRYGQDRGDSSAKKIGGGAVAGAILGAIIGGAKGAAVGATAGAGGGTAMVMAGERSPAEFQSGAEVTARILSPVTVTVER